MKSKNTIPKIGRPKNWKPWAFGEKMRKRYNHPPYDKKIKFGDNPDNYSGSFDRR